MTTKPAIQPILVPVDFSEHSEAALLLAAEFAACLGCPIIVLHVVHDPGEAPGFYAGRHDKNEIKKMEDVASEMMQEFMERMTREHPDLSSLVNARTTLISGMLGSKAEQVVRLCPVPVTIVKAHHEDEQEQ